MILTQRNIISNNEINCPPRVFKIVLRDVGGIGNFAEGGGLFYQVVGTSGGVILTIQNFFKVKAAFHKY